MSNLLPPNASQVDKALNASGQRIENIDLSVVSTLWNADTCPIELLPYLAWAESVPEWTSDWSENIQRQTIKNQRTTRKKRGTRKAVQDAVAALGGAVSITEWWETNPKGTPGTFAVVITGGAGYVEGGYQQAMMNAINYTKPLTAHHTLTVGLTLRGDTGMAGAARPARFMRLNFLES